MAQQLTKSLVGALTLVGIIIMLWSHHWIVELHTQSLRVDADEKGALHQRSINNELKRFGFLPFIIARDEQLIEWSFNQPKQANIALESIVKSSGTNNLYVLDNKGTTLSSSNWRSDLSFVGKNYGFRPYFIDSIAGSNGYFFGIGATSKVPGFFISTPVREGANIIAVAVTKVHLSTIEKTWVDLGEKIFVTNSDGVVILSSLDEWKYHSLLPLNAQQMQKIEKQKQFAGLTIDTLSERLQASDNKIKINGVSYLHKVLDINDVGWRLHYLTPVSAVTQLAIATWAKIGSIALALIAILLLLRLLQSRWRLSISQNESEELRVLNKTLQTEITQRQKVEEKLLVAQKGIKRSSKLAAMGQLSASIIHELGQPLSAMKTYIVSSQVPDEKNQMSINHVLTMLPKLENLVDRMSDISRQLKFFTRSGENPLSLIDIRHALNQALTITHLGLEDEEVGVEVLCEDVPYLVMAGQVRMEQVFVNLINNARAAMAHCKTKKITVRIETKKEEGQIIIKVKDVGEGMSSDTLHALFDPFYTTKPSGVSLGLGLTISTNIIHEFHGSLTAMNNTSKGACFIITLPMAE
jgi:two-component system C4-dicarboxylate transport sensor histidine kinase DctB